MFGALGLWSLLARPHSTAQQPPEEDDKTEGGEVKEPDKHQLAMEETQHKEIAGTPEPYIKAERTTPESMPLPATIAKIKTEPGLDEEAMPKTVDNWLAISKAKGLFVNLPPSPCSLSPSPPPPGPKQETIPWPEDIGLYRLAVEDTREGMQMAVKDLDRCSLKSPSERKPVQFALPVPQTPVLRKHPYVPEIGVLPEFSPAAHLHHLNSRANFTTPDGRCRNAICTSAISSLQTKLDAANAATSKLQADYLTLQQVTTQAMTARAAETEMWNKKLADQNVLLEGQIKAKDALRVEKERKERFIMDLKQDVERKERVITGLQRKLDDTQRKLDDEMDHYDNLKDKMKRSDKDERRMRRKILEEAALRVGSLLCQQRRGGLVDPTSLSRIIEDAIMDKEPERSQSRSSTPQDNPLPRSSAPSETKLPKKPSPPPPPPPETNAPPPPAPPLSVNQTNAGMNGRKFVNIKGLLKSYLQRDGFLKKKDKPSLEISERPPTATEAIVVVFHKYNCELRDFISFGKTFMKPFSELRYESLAPFFGLSASKAGKDIPDMPMHPAALPSTIFHRISYDVEQARILYSDSSSGEASRLLEGLFREIALLFQGAFKHKTGDTSYLPPLPAKFHYNLHRFTYDEHLTNIIILQFSSTLSSPPISALPVFLAHASCTAFFNAKCNPTFEPTPIIGIITDSSTFTFCLYTPHPSDPGTPTLTWSPALTGLSSLRSDSASIRRERLENTTSYLFSAFLFAFLLALHATKESPHVNDAARIAHVRFTDACALGKGEARDALIEEAEEFLKIAVETVKLPREGVKREAEEEGGREEKRRR